MHKLCSSMLEADMAHGLHLHADFLVGICFLILGLNLGPHTGEANTPTTEL